jgi:hypothetical protein
MKVNLKLWSDDKSSGAEKKKRKVFRFQTVEKIGSNHLSALGNVCTQVATYYDLTSTRRIIISMISTVKNVDPGANRNRSA